ncbi:MAG: hypothetical protein ACXQT0_02165 [Candidatus Methanofastidiosia archaeon]
MIFTRMMELEIIKEHDPKQLSEELFNYSLYLFFEHFILHYGAPLLQRAC